MTIIKPTLGRIMWLTPHPAAGEQSQQAALVAHVNDDGTVNLTVSAPDGTTYALQNVPVVQDGDAQLQVAYASWMPYQLGQAAKTEAAAVGNAVATQSAIQADGQTSASPSLDVSLDGDDTGNVHEAAGGSNTVASSSDASSDSSASSASTVVEEAAHETFIEKVEHGAEHIIEEVKNAL